MTKLTRKEAADEEAYQDMLSDLKSGEAAIVSEARGGGYNLAYSCSHVGLFRTLDQVWVGLASLMEKHKFWPDVYYVNERGNTDLLSFSYRKTKTGKLGYIKVKTLISWV